MEKLIPYEQALRLARKSTIDSLLRYLLQPDLLPQGHAFYVVVVPKVSGVILPATWMDKDEVTLVLQHQWKNARIENEILFIDLCFSGKWSRCVIPFESIQTFSDYHAGFAVHKRVTFTETPPPPPEPEPAPDTTVVSLDSFRKKT